MKKITLDNIEEIKEEHYNYCTENAHLQKAIKKLTDDEKRALFIENPIDYSCPDNLNVKYHKIFKKFSKRRKGVFINEYESFRDYKKTKWCGYKFINELNLDVCPYCGMSYFSIVEKKVKGRTIFVAEATLDHYLPKEKYPLLALNIYNLIPVCHACNSTYKSRNAEPILNPHMHSVENFIKFEVSVEDIINTIIDNKDVSEIIINNRATDKKLHQLTDNHIEVLNLKNRYNKKTHIAKSTIKKKLWYNDSFLAQLNNLNIDIDSCELENMLIKQDIFNENEPFIKLKNDIWKQV